jgi:phosphoglucosamine mutase
MVEVISKTGISLSGLVQDYRVYPQVHRNVAVARKDDFSLYPEIILTTEKIEKQLANHGRFNLRYSGTEPLARIMLEGQDLKELEELADQMANVLSQHLGVKP